MAEKTPGASISIASLILPLINTLVILAAAGLGFYSKLIYKRPAFQEEKERERLISTHATPTVEGTRAFINFGPITANISAVPEQPAAADGTFRQIEGKLHYVTLSFSLEIKDQEQQSLIENIRPQFLDKLNHLVGKKRFNDLTSVQGRYVLQAELIEIANHLVASVAPNLGGDLATNIYFTQFIVQ